MEIVMEWLAAGMMSLTAVGVTLWMAGALYFDACGGGRRGKLVLALWLGAALAMFILWQPLWQPWLVLMASLGLLLTWWLRQKPRHDRDWDPSVSRLPRAVIDGDAITMENVRHFEYRSLTDFDSHYETRQLHFSNLCGADLILFNWGSRLMSHPVLVFDFGPDGRLCISIEVRYRNGQNYSILRSFYRQQELIFLVADERDAILRRTKHGKPQTAHLYRLTVPMERVRLVFGDYLDAINRIVETPRWYHGLCANCTTTFYRLTNARRIRDWRVIVNGEFDKLLYEHGRLDASRPFDELRRLALINEIANAAPKAGFSETLRLELEKRRHGP